MNQPLIATVIGVELLVEGLILLVVRRLWPPPPAPWRRTTLTFWGIAAFLCTLIIAVPTIKAPGLGAGLIVALIAPIVATATLTLTLIRIRTTSRSAARLFGMIDSNPLLVARMERNWLLRRALRQVSRHRPGT